VPFGCPRFEADDLELQDEPLQIRVMDYDTYSANDAIGKVSELIGMLRSECIIMNTFVDVLQRFLEASCIFFSNMSPADF